MDSTVFITHILQSLFHRWSVLTLKARYLLLKFLFQKDKTLYLYMIDNLLSPW